MKIFLFLLLLFSAPAFAVSSSVSDYASAQKCYRSLDKSSAKGFGHCQQLFERVIKKYPGTAQARKSLFSTARLAEAKNDVTKDDKDLEQALKTYNQYLRENPKDSMADDCLYQISKIRFEKMNDREKALRALTAIVERYPNGDRAEAASKDLRHLNGEEAKPVIDIQKQSDPDLETESDQEPQAAAPPKSTTQDFAIHTVVIDPGHGGKDQGAKGVGGAKEAEVTLQIARKLAVQLKKKLGVEVFLSRTNQKGLSLPARNHFATDKNADLFISIHANSHSSPNISGIQTFYLNNATSKAAQELANRENKIAGKALSLSEKILTTMLQNADTLESKELAQAVQQSLVSRLKQNYSGVKDLHVETAIFQVLDGARCPSILVETSFITNPTEEKRLKDSQYQWSLAKGIATGVEKYIGSRQSLAKASSL